MNENVPSLTCSSCSHENTLDSIFCENCGEVLDQLCSNCSTLNKTEAKFCKKCGTALARIQAEQGITLLSELQQSAPAGVQEKMRATSSEIEGERKPVTILFTDIVGSTAIAEKLDPEVWKEIVSGAHKRVGEAIYRYEGTIAQLLGDGVLAFFGAPITHEDDPVRAVRAALDIQETIRYYEHELVDLVDSFQMRVGINTGEVVIGSIGTDMHMEYLALGDAVNIAARLQSAAEPGKALLSGSSARLIGDAFELRSLGEITVKGKEEPVESFEIVGAKATAEIGRAPQEYQTPYVGRKIEVEELRESLLKLCEGQGQIVSLIGEAGIGKTRLLEEVREILCGKDDVVEAATPPSSIRWLEGRALSYGGSLSYWTITQLLLDDLDLSDGTPQVEIKVTLRRRVRELFGEERAKEVLPFLANLLGIKGGPEADERIQSLDGETLKAQTLKSVNDYFSQVAHERSSVLIFEDMHWLDPSSLDVLEGFLHLTDQAPLMILMLMRIDRNHGSWGVKIKAETDLPHRYKEIHLRRLSEGDSHNLLVQLLGESELPEEIWHAITNRSEGNPFYLEEVVRHLTEQELIIQDDEGLHATKELEEIGIPDTLQGVLLARIDRLEEEVRRTLQMASVIGKSFLYRLLEAIAEAERELDEHLSQLQRVDLVREKARLPELEYIFKHSMTQEAAYNSLLVERRKEFHRKVGEALERLFPDRTEDFLGLLAHHFEAADAVENAVDYLIRAGDNARLGDALQEAHGYYRRAVKLLDTLEDDERCVRTWQKIALVHQMDFQFQDAHRAYETAFKLERKANAWRQTTSDIVKKPEVGPRVHFRYFRHPKALDPGKMSTIIEAQICYGLYAGLTEVDLEMNVVPHVSRSWEVLDEGTRYIFHLRDDVFWSDGTPLTAADFEWAWIRNLGLGKDAYFPEMLDVIVGAREYRTGKTTDSDSVGVRALDPVTLEVRLCNPVAYFMYLVALPNTFPLPRSAIERHGDNWWKQDNIVSNGAFLLKRFDEAQVELERNMNYFGEYAGNLHGATWKFIPEGRGRIREHLDELADVIWLEDPERIPPQIPLSEVQHVSNVLSTLFLVFNPTQPPLDNVRVRRALAHALDCRQILKSRRGHDLAPHRGGVVPIGMPGHSPGIALKQDISSAQCQLAEAGYADGLEFPPLILECTRPYSEYSTDVVQQWHEKLGIETILEEVSLEVSWQDFPINDVLLYSWWLDYPDPHSMLFHSNAYDFLRRAGWKDDRYDKLIERAVRMSSRSSRMELYRQADRFLVSEEVLIVPIGYGMDIFAVLAKPWVKNLIPNALGYLGLRDISIERE